MANIHAVVVSREPLGATTLMPTWTRGPRVRMVLRRALTQRLGADVSTPQVDITVAGVDATIVGVDENVAGADGNVMGTMVRKRGCLHGCRRRQ
jgi:hypothetical protein